VLRTTHLSGTLTSLDIFLGRRWRGLPLVDARRVRLLLAHQPRLQQVLG
jgi:hypothetical protein